MLCPTTNVVSGLASATDRSNGKPTVPNVAFIIKICTYER